MHKRQFILVTCLDGLQSLFVALLGLFESGFKQLLAGVAVLSSDVLGSGSVVVDQVDRRQLLAQKILSQSGDVAVLAIKKLEFFIAKLFKMMDGTTIFFVNSVSKLRIKVIFVFQPDGTPYSVKDECPNDSCPSNLCSVLSFQKIHIF